MKEHLCTGIIPAIAIFCSCYATAHLMPSNQFLVFMTAILAAPIRMENQSRRWLPLPYFHFQRFNDQSFIHPV
jgi:hypothetical protein